MSEAHCPSCGNDEAIVRVRGNAFSAVCTQCGDAVVTPLLDSDDLLTTEGETFEAELFELEAARSGCAGAVVTQVYVDEAAHFAVELRLPVPPR